MKTRKSLIVVGSVVAVISVLQFVLVLIKAPYVSGEGGLGYAYDFSIATIIGIGGLLIGALCLGLSKKIK